MQRMLVQKGFILNSSKCLQEGEKTADLHIQTFQRTGKKVILLNLLYETCIVSIPKPDKNIIRMKDYKSISIIYTFFKF